MSDGIVFPLADGELSELPADCAATPRATETAINAAVKPTKTSTTWGGLMTLLPLNLWPELTAAAVKAEPMHFRRSPNALMLPPPRARGFEECKLALSFARW
jgi:hypothetical protein